MPNPYLLPNAKVPSFHRQFLTIMEDYFFCNNNTLRNRQTEIVDEGENEKDLIIIIINNFFIIVIIIIISTLFYVIIPNVLFFAPYNKRLPLDVTRHIFYVRRESES